MDQVCGTADLDPTKQDQKAGYQHHQPADHTPKGQKARHVEFGCGICCLLQDHLACHGRRCGYDKQACRKSYRTSEQIIPLRRVGG